MSWLSGLRQRIREVAHPDRADAEFEEELADHLAREADRQVREGATPADARRYAAIRSGSMPSAREAGRDERSGRMLLDAGADFRFAWRAALRNPGFTAAVVVSLALGVGGTAAVFSVVNAVLLRPLAYPGADRLFNVRIWWNDFSSTLSQIDLEALEERANGGQLFGAYFRPADGFAMATPAGPVLIDGAIVTTRLPQVLGIGPIVGPGFSSTPSTPEALIGEKLWRERYGASAAAIGQAIVLDGDSYTIMGVMPVGFNVPAQPNGDVWLKAVTRPRTRRSPFYLHTVARLPPGREPESVAAELTSQVSIVLRDKYAVEPVWHYRLRPLKETIVGNVRPTLLLLLGAMTLVLLIAIVNVTNLFLARGTVRARELAVRASLGAGRGRLARHLLAESALLGTLGGIAGAWIAVAIHRLAGAAVARMVPRFDEIRLDWTVGLFALACGVSAGLVAGVLPALRLPWHRLAAFLRDGGRSAGQAPGRARARQALVIAEIALTVAVLTGAVLLTKSFVRLQALDPGFRPAGLASFRLTLPDDPYANEDRLEAFLQDLDQRLRATPGVTAVALSISLPPDQLVLSNNYTMEGGSPGTAGFDGVAEWNVVTEEYFSTMGIRLLRGRTFTSTDRRGAPDVAVVNESFVQRHYPDGQVLGRRLKGGTWDPAAPWTTIVGVVADVPYGKGLWGGSDATVYRPYAQNLWVQVPYVVVKTDVDPSRLMPSVEQLLRTMDARLPVRNFATMDDRLRSSMLEPRVRSFVVALIAGLALALSITGIYGVMAYYVTQRRRETAIRRALGATQANVVSATIGVGLRLACAGILLGTAGALMLTKSLSTMLFHVHPRDPGAVASVAGMLSLAALLACAVPAMRSARVEPALVLRDE